VAHDRRRRSEAGVNEPLMPLGGIIGQALRLKPGGPLGHKRHS